jgi:hypothetical protein
MDADADRDESMALTRGRLAAVAVGIVTVAVGAVFLAVFVRSWAQDEGGSYAPQRPVTRASITPERSLFGQVLTFRADVVVDPRKIDVSSVALAPNFKPFRIRGESRSTTAGVGHASVVSFRYRLQCVSRACLPIEKNRGATEFRLPPSQATMKGRDGAAVTARVAWPTFGVQSRLTDSDIGLSTPTVDRPMDVPAISWAVSPGLLGGLAAGAAILLVLGAGVLVATVVVRDSRRLRTRRIPAHLSPIERALVLAEHAAAHGEVPESRKALERLAVELRRRGGGGQADEVEHLAWSEDGPSEEAVAQLATTVRSNGAR